MTLFLALDGHDGSGKTTLAKQLATQLNGIYVRPYGKPVGVSFLGTAEQGDHKVAVSLATQAVSKLLKQHQGADAVVFDRCWLTVFTVVPEKFFVEWPFFVPTVLCWTNLDTTLARLATRNEHAYSVAWRRHYIELYLRLAKQFDCTVIDTSTSTIDESVERILVWAKELTTS